MPKQRPTAKSLAPKSPGEQTETGKQIKGALGGIGQGLAALFSEKPAAPQQERPVLPMQTRDYVEKGTYGQYQPGEIMNRARSNRELFKAGKKYTPRQSDYVASQMVYTKDPRPRQSQELMDYVSEGTEGQWGKNDPKEAQKWGLIRMGMDAREQERANGSRGHFDAGHT